MSFPHGLELAPCTGYDTWPDDFPGLPFVAGVSDGQYVECMLLRATCPMTSGVKS
jgi:hypothetical protein